MQKNSVLFRRIAKGVVSSLLLMSALPSFSQGREDMELLLMRENRRLQTQVDSLSRIVAALGAEDELWAQLTGLDEDPFSWGTGISGLEDLTGLDRVIAERLSSVFPEMQIAYHSSIREKVASYCRGRNAVILSRSFSRLRNKMPYFKEVFEQYGVPVELIPLCVVESAVSREAVSPAGAVGLWQLMPDTARGYSLRVNREVDDRYSIEKSTDAAARLLRDLKQALGSWPLAVMAYNCGSARVRKAMMATGKTDPWVVWKRVPAETKAYLPSLLAIGYLWTHGEEYGIK